MQGTILRVVSWDRSHAWTNDIAHARNILIRMLRRATPIGHVQAKRLVRSVLAGTESEVVLQDATLVQPMRNALESIGAQVELDPP